MIEKKNKVGPRLETNTPSIFAWPERQQLVTLMTLYTTHNTMDGGKKEAFASWSFARAC